MPPATEQVRRLAIHKHHTLSWRVNTASSVCCRRRRSTHATCRVVAFCLHMPPRMSMYLVMRVSAYRRILNATAEYGRQQTNEESNEHVQK